MVLVAGPWMWFSSLPSGAAVTVIRTGGDKGFRLGGKKGRERESTKGREEEKRQRVSGGCVKPLAVIGAGRVQALLSQAGGLLVPL